MADKEKKVTQDSKVDKATTEESKAAAKVAKAAKGSKSDKPGFFARAGKGTKRFFKDFKGETKKIVWPDAKTVLKSTGIVLIVVTIVTLAVLAIDFSLERGITGLKTLAKGESTSLVTPGNVEETDDSEETTEADAKETTEAKSEDPSAEETTAGTTEE